MPSIQETLEDFRIEKLDFSKCTSVFDLLVEFKRIKTITIKWNHDDNNDEEEEEWELKTKQFEEEMKKKHPKIDIYIY